MTRQKKPDPYEAKSMLSAAKQDMAYVLSLPVTAQGSQTILRSLYEDFRSVGNALLIAEGIEESDHVPMIKRVIALQVTTPRPIGVLENFRRLRHDVNYRGYVPTLADVQDFADFAKSCWKPVLEEAERIINSKIP